MSGEIIFGDDEIVDMGTARDMPDLAIEMVRDLRALGTLANQAENSEAFAGEEKGA